MPRPPRTTSSGARSIFSKLPLSHRAQADRFTEITIGWLNQNFPSWPVLLRRWVTMPAANSNSSRCSAAISFCPSAANVPRSTHVVNIVAGRLVQPDHLIELQMLGPIGMRVTLGLAQSASRDALGTGPPNNAELPSVQT